MKPQEPTQTNESKKNAQTNQKAFQQQPSKPNTRPSTSDETRQANRNFDRERDEYDTDDMNEMEDPDRTGTEEYQFDDSRKQDSRHVQANTQTNNNRSQQPTVDEGDPATPIQPRENYAQRKNQPNQQQNQNQRQTDKH